MATDEEQLSRRALALWATGNTDTPDAIFTADYVNHQQPFVGDGDPALGLARYGRVLAGHHAAFASSQLEILRQLGDGDRVATHWRLTVQQTGEYLGSPPSGKRASWTGVQIDRHSGGKIAESWVVWDHHTQLKELGLLQSA